MFGSHWGPADKVGDKLSKLICNEVGCGPKAVTCRVEQRRDTLGYMETFVAPLNNAPSHICVFEIAARDRKVEMEVDIDGDRDCPLGVHMRGTTGFVPAEDILVQPALFGIKYTQGADFDRERLAQAGLHKTLKRCVNGKYANVINPSTFVRIAPFVAGSECFAYCMPKDRWGFATFDQLGIGPFFGLLEGLEKLG